MSFMLAELVHVFHLAAWFTGLLVFICGPILLVYWFAVCDKIGSDFERYAHQGDSSSYTLDPRLDQSNNHKSISDILSDCMSLRSQLNYHHRTLCERAGVDPDSGGAMIDLITEAVFDGRKINQCVYELELKETQHA